MSHIHTEPGQHDTVVSFYIIRTDSSVPRVLVHMHRKIHKLSQLGGHVELTENPWQAVVRELKEESGYTISELQVLQPVNTVPEISGPVVHPVPAACMTFKNPNEHYHSDLGYAFVSSAAPHSIPDENESQDLRWLTLSEYQDMVKNGDALRDAYDVYTYVVNELLPRYVRIDASHFSTLNPTHAAFEKEIT